MENGLGADESERYSNGEKKMRCEKKQREK